MVWGGSGYVAGLVAALRDVDVVFTAARLAACQRLISHSSWCYDLDIQSAELAGTGAAPIFFSGHLLWNVL